MAQEFEKLLVAIDDSEIADQALHLAIGIAIPDSSRLDVLHVVTPPAPPTVEISSPLLGPSVPTIIPLSVASTQSIPEDSDFIAKFKGEELLAESKAEIQKASQSFKNKKRLECETILLRSSDVAREIIRTSKEGAYDLVIVGSRGLGILKSFFLGSVSKKVAKEAKCSVLVVKKVSGTLNKFLLGYDGSEEGKKALNIGASLGKNFNAVIDPICVVSFPPLMLTIEQSTINNLEGEMKSYAIDAVTSLKNQGVPTSRGIVIDSPSISGAIEEYSTKNSYDLVIVGNHPKGKLETFLLGSVSSDVVEQSKTNVLVVK